MIKGFIFDLDGVITDTAELHFIAWKEIVKKLNIDYKKEDNEKLKGLSRLDTLKAIINISKNNLALTDEQLASICEEKNEFYKKLLQTHINKNSLLENIFSFISKAKSRNLKLAIASSSHNAPTILEKLEIKHFFDFIVNPANVKNGKPAKDIFIQAAQGLNLDPRECIGFEDAPAGVMAIKNANMIAVVISQELDPTFKTADLVVKSTKDLDLDFIMQKFAK
ncbi:beta-phosphoglucomutase [Mesomycoplasma hyorhinis]|uniref:beta-phosphoglucomutase n=1 Tax=Mesomycoplasma hyorhinis TaxID=2100 RepID=UPI001C0406D7|nr:beta-phosphoglucomutase [Mesomycoplasma hyorhinis]